jgi:hypothetical protein
MSFIDDSSYLSDMYLITKYARLILLLVFPLVSYGAFAQNTQAKFNRDSSKTITLNEFNQRVDRAIMLLKTKALNEISDTDHISIMMCDNTIFMAMVKESRPKIIKSSDGDQKVYLLKPRFTGGRYKELEKIISSKHYVEGVVTIYPDWRPNRGMGAFFPKLQMEIDGTPEPYSVFQVTDK